MLKKIFLLCSALVASPAMVLGSDTIVTIAGTGVAGSSQSGAATAAQLSSPTGIVLDQSNNIYFADSANHWLLKIDVTSNQISIFAGNGSAGFQGDGGAATAAKLNAPSALAFDSSGNLYIADTGNNRIREVAHATGNISTIAGINNAGSSGDNGLAVSAALNGPMGLAIDASNNIFIADTSNSRIRKINSVTNIITTICGSTAGFGGDNGPVYPSTEFDASKILEAGSAFVSSRRNIPAPN